MTVGSRRGLACIVVLLGCAAEPTAVGQPLTFVLAPASVLILPSACGSELFAGGAFLDILRTELRVDGVDRVVVAPAAPGESPVLAEIALRAEPCDSTVKEVVVTIEDRATSKRVERRVLVGDTAEPARPRALALAVAELLRATWLELAMPAAPPPQAPVPEPVRAAAFRRSAASRPLPPAGGPLPPPLARDREVSVVVAGREFPGANAAFVGGHAAGASPFLSPALSLRIDLGALFGTARDPLGDVNLGMATVGAALLLSSPGEATVAVAVGPRLEIGVGWASGNPLAQVTSSYAGSGFVSAASLLGTSSFRLTDRWRLAVELEAGASIVPIEALADARRVSGTQGGMLGLAIGVAQLR
jgi:hypothetical protein